MARCKKTLGLEVHHIRLEGSNALDNAQVLCAACRKGIPTYNGFGKTPPPFEQITKFKALVRSGKRCQCTSTKGCH